MTLQAPRQPVRPEAPTQAEPYPWRVGLAILLAIVVGAGLLAFAMGVMRTPSQQSGSEVSGQPAQAAGTSVTVAQPGGASQPQATAVSTASTNPATSEATPLATQIAAGPGTAGSEATSTSAQATPVAQATSIPVVPTVGAENTVESITSATTTADPDTVAAVLNAYLRYWTVRVRAMNDPFAPGLDLGQAMAGDELAAAQKTLDEYRAADGAYRTKVDHQIGVKYVTATEAAIFDDFTGTTVKLDPNTGEPAPNIEPIVEPQKSTFILRPINGTWKVVGRAAEN